MRTWKMQWFIAFLILLCGTPLWAQLTAGSVVGTVTDPSGAKVAGANVTITNTSTGVAYSTVTSSQGIFTFPVLPVGLYEFTTDAKGFKKANGSLEVDLNASRTLNIALMVGSTSETVQVTAAQTPVETTSTQISDTFSRRQVLDLPLASVNVNNLALLTPNTVDINTTGLNRAQVLQKVSSPVGGAVASVGGTRARNNSFILDGVDNNDPIETGPQSGAIQDAVQEFSVVKNNFDAEFGQFAGGQFNIITKTGTNLIHGSAFWYGQNRHLNASDFGAQTLIQQGVLTEKPRFDYNRLGGTIGGPIVKQKLYYFGAYEFENLGAAGNTTSTLFPTDEGMQVLSTIPEVSPFILGFLDQFGATATQAAPASDWPTVFGTPISVGPVSRSFPSFSTSHRFLGSIDWMARANDQLHFRFNYDRGPNQLVPGFPQAGFNSSLNVDNLLFSIAHVHTFSPRVLNELRIAYHHQSTGNSLVDPAVGNLPNIVVAAGPLIGPSASVPSGSFDHIYQLNDNVTWQKGKHIMKFGADLRNNIVTDISSPAPRGDYEYSSLQEFVTDSVPTINGQRGVGAVNLNLNNYTLNFYAQDQFKITPRLTLYLGVRYEYNSLIHDLAAQQEESIADVPGVITFRKPTVEKNNWAPRLGFAWDVFGTGRTAFRGGYGIAYAPIFGAYVGGGLLPTTVQQVFFTDCLPDCPIPIPGSNFLENGGIPNILAPLDTPEHARAAIATYIPDIERPYVQTSTFEFEHEISKGFTFTGRYLHTKGTHLSIQARLNAPIVPPMSSFLPTFFNPSEVPGQSILDTMPTLSEFLAQVVPPFAQYGFSGLLTTHLPIGNSTYDAGSFEIARRFSSGFQMDANYTWSKFIDQGTNEFFNSFINPRRPQDWRNLANERGLSVLDVPHRFVVHAVWDTPWFRNGSGVSRGLLGNWTIAGSYAVSSGQPFTALSVANSVGNGDRQVQRTIINPTASNDTGTDVTPVTNSGGDVVAYLAMDSTSRFVRAQTGSFPTARRNNLRAPGISNVDFAVSKNITFGEQMSLQFGAQFFNLLNHPQFTAANLLAVDPGLGLNYGFVASPSFNDMKGSGGTGGARLIQLIAKFSF